MKKTLCMVIALIMVLSSFVVYADTDTLFTALEKGPLSANTHTEYSLELHKPLDFINELYNEDEYMADVPFDFKMLAESAFSITETADMSYIVSDDGKKVKIAVSSEMSLPLEFNDSFKTDIWAKTGTWIDIDFSDEENPKFVIIYKIPFDKNYFVIDYADLVDIDEFDTEKFTEYLKKYSNEEFQKEFNTFFKELVLNNMTIEETSSNQEYILKTDDKGFKNIVKGMADRLFDVISDALAVQEEIDNEEYRYQFEQYLTVLDEFEILGKDGLTVKISLKNRKISVSDFSLHLNFNLHDAITAFGGDMSNFNRDNWEIDCTISTNTSYENVDENITVDFPELTEENSNRIYDSDYDYTPMYNYISIYPSNDIEIDSGGNFMVTLKDAMRGCNISKKYYKTEDDKIIITPREGQYDFVTAEMSVGSDVITVDGVQATLYTSVVKQEDGTILIPIDAIAIMTGYTLKSVNKYFDEEEYSGPDRIEFTRINPEYVEENEDDYVSPWIDIYGEGVPVIANDELYLPVNAAMGGFGVPEENIKAANGEVTVTSGSADIPEFTEIKLSVNSNEVYINSEKITLNNTVIEKDGNIYIPLQLLTSMNCSIISIEYFLGNNHAYTVQGIRNTIQEQNAADYESYIPEYNSLFVEEEGKPVIEDGEYYLPLWPLMGELMVSGDDIHETETSATITSVDPVTGFNTLVIEGTSVIMDDKQFTMTKPMIKRNEKNYLPSEFVTSILNGKINAMRVYYNEEKISYNFGAEVPNPLYVEGE